MKARCEGRGGSTPRAQYQSPTPTSHLADGRRRRHRPMDYRSSEITRSGSSAVMFNPFEDFEPSENLNGPVTIIEVNERVRQIDALQRRGTFVSDYSAVKATLSVSNLRVVKHRTPPGRVAETRQYISSAPREKRVRHSGRFCEGGGGCKTELSPDAQGILCVVCFRKTLTAGRLERDAARKAAGTRVRRAQGKLPRLQCDSCTRMLRAGRPAGRCFHCTEKQRRKPVS